MIHQGIPGLTKDFEPEIEDFPRVETDLLEALEARYPDKCPDLRISDKEFGVYVGQLNVVRLLREMHDRPIELKEPTHVHTRS
jgi:hypothetical protein